MSALHEPYVREVVRLLRANSVNVTDWYADECDPMLAAIETDTGRSFCWNEEDGWYTGVDKDGRGELDRAYWANLGELPEPVEVSSWAVRVVRGETKLGREHWDRPRYRHFDENVAEFARRLRDLGNPKRGVAL